jgi:DNA-binding Xre family transcriptional regulator
MLEEELKTERRRQEVEAIKKVMRSDHKGRGAPLPGLLACRWGSGYSQQELAERAGIARTTIRALECGERRAQASTLRRISEALAVSPADLLTSEVVAEEE